MGLSRIVSERDCVFGRNRTFSHICVFNAAVDGVPHWKLILPVWLKKTRMMILPDGQKVHSFVHNAGTGHRDGHKR